MNDMSLCGAECDKCGYGRENGCKGCEEANCAPFGKPCFAANYIKAGGLEAFEAFKEKLIGEISDLGIFGLPPIDELLPINGAFINIEYRLPNGKYAKILNDDEIYLGTQIENEFSDGTVQRFFGIAANTDFILVGEYSPDFSEPEIIVYKKR